MNQLCYKQWIFYKTLGKSYNIYPIELSFLTIPTSLIPCNKIQMNELCKSGCKSYGRNGGCPPYAPNYVHFINKFKNATVIFIKLLTRHYPPKSLNGKHYVRWNFTETFMPKLLLEIMRPISETLQGLILASGHCKFCRKCNFKEGNKTCLHPKDRTFSLEATGVDICSLMQNFSDSPILWWSKDNSSIIPNYQLRVGAILHNLEIDRNEYYTLLSLGHLGNKLYLPKDNNEAQFLIENDFLSINKSGEC